MKNRFPPRSILAAVDGSPPSFAALMAAKTLAARLGSRLEALYVEAALPLGPFEPAFRPLDGGKRALREDIERYLIAALAELPADRRAVRVVAGQPVAELVRRAAPRTADLVVMGTHGRQGAERFLMGSTAEAVFHRARVPVLAVREGQELAPREILVPCNLERYADDAMLYAIELAGAFDARITALLVTARVEKDLDPDRLLADHLAQVCGTQAATEIKRLARPGDAREQIAVEAESGKYGLIVLSSHRRDQLSDLALGTTAERLLRRCEAPLLAVPAGATRPTACGPSAPRGGRR